MHVAQCQPRMRGHDLVGSQALPFMPDGNVLHLGTMAGYMRLPTAIAGHHDDVFPAQRWNRISCFSA
jgi:hypothetical protein